MNMFTYMNMYSKTLLEYGPAPRGDTVMMRWKFASMLAVIVCCASQAHAQVGGYPKKPIRVINPFVAGGGVDAIFRPLLQKVGENIKQQFVIDNRPGANGMIGMNLAAKAPADGYTVVIGTTGAVVMNPSVYDNITYDPIRDFVPITNVAHSAFILCVHPSVQATDLKSLIEIAKRRPGDVSYSSFGIGSSAHLGAEMFSQIAAVKLLHVPYKGSAEAVVALLSGEVMMSFDSMQSTMPHIRNKRLKPIGLAAVNRSPAAPELPTIAEQGLAGFEVGSWYGLLAPAGTPKAIVDYLNAEVTKAMASPEIKERLSSLGLELIGNSSEQFGVQIRSDLVKWKKVAQTGHIRADN
jgi:tripartite-type tricarboxylate transporter receptor subunit TctC